MILTLDVTDEQRSAVRRGDAVELVLGDLGEIVIVSKDAYETLMDYREKAAWSKLGQKALEQWARENPFEA
jgi:hypothetical protein